MGFLDFFKEDKGHKDLGKIVFTGSNGESLGEEESLAIFPGSKIDSDNAATLKSDEIKKGVGVAGDLTDKKSMIKNIKEIAGIDEAQLNVFYEKMNTEEYKVRELLENILIILTAEEKEGKSAEELVEVFKKQVSGDNLARIVAAFIILIERDEVEKVLVKKTRTMGNLGEELAGIGVSMS